MAILSILLTVVIIAVSILMVMVVMIQRPKQEGLGAAFGGGALDSALGAHTTDVLQKFTTWLGILFFVSAIGLAMVKTREFRASAANNPLEGVEAKKTEIPAGLPPELLNIPGLEGLSVEPGTAPPTVNEGAVPTETTTPATPDQPKAAETPKAGETPAPAPEAPKSAAPAPAPEAPKSAALAPAPTAPAPAPEAPKSAAPAPAPAAPAPAPEAPKSAAPAPAAPAVPAPAPEAAEKAKEL